MTPAFTKTCNLKNTRVTPRMRIITDGRFNNSLSLWVYYYYYFFVHCLMFVAPKKNRKKKIKKSDAYADFTLHLSASCWLRNIMMGNKFNDIIYNGAFSIIHHIIME